MKKLFTLFSFLLVALSGFGQHGTFTDVRLINGDSIISGTGNGTIFYNRVSNKFRFRQNGVWVSLGVSSIWGSITGTLSAQTDLQTALNLKANLISPSFTTPALGTPSSGVGINLTGIPEGALSLTDITTNNSTSSRHGLLKKLSNSATDYMDGTGNWSTPAGGGGSLPSQTGKINYELGTDGTNPRWENSNRVYNVENYGALHDYETVSDANVTSGTATLTSATAAFVTGDTGKTIRVFGAGAAGVDLITTMTYVNTTTVTLGTNASTSITTKQIEWGSDDTQEIQAAINACNTFGGGTVYFPLGVYLIAGALVTSADGSNPNSQIYFPLSPYQLISGRLGSIKLLGEVEPHIFVGPLATQYPNRMTGQVVLKSIITGSGTLPAVIGSTFSGAVGNFTKGSIENIAIQTKTLQGTTAIAGTMTAFMFGYMEVVGGVNNIAAFTETDVFNSVEPTNPTYGVYFPVAVKSENYGGVHGYVHAAGYNVGIRIGEHDSGLKYMASGCVYGLQLIATSTAHGHNGVFHSNGNKYDVYLSGGGGINYTIFGEAYPSSINVKWYNNVNTFYVPSAATFFGRIDVMMVRSGGGLITYSASTPSNILGNLIIKDYHSSSIKFGQGDPAITVSTGSSVAGNSNSIIESGTGGVSAGLTSIIGVFQTASNQANASGGLVGQYQMINSNISAADKRFWTMYGETNGANNSAKIYEWMMQAGVLTQVNQRTSTIQSYVQKTYFGSATTTPTSTVDILAGTTAVAPLGLNSGPLLTTPLAGKVEFLTDDLYFTRTTGTTRMKVVFVDNTLTSGTVPVATTNGRLTDGLILAESSYTPALTNTTNVTASTAYVTGYYRIGSSVTVYGKIDIDATLAASTATELQIALPIASAMTLEEDLGGTAVSDAVASLTARIKADASTDRASVVFKALSLSNDSYSFEFSYKIK